MFGPWSVVDPILVTKVLPRTERFPMRFVFCMLMTSPK
jgi:hypothetical protein